MDRTSCAARTTVASQWAVRVAVETRVESRPRVCDASEGGEEGGKGSAPSPQQTATRRSFPTAPDSCTDACCPSSRLQGTLRAPLGGLVATLLFLTPPPGQPPPTPPKDGLDGCISAAQRDTALEEKRTTIVRVGKGGKGIGKEREKEGGDGQAGIRGSLGFPPEGRRGVFRRGGCDPLRSTCGGRCSGPTRRTLWVEYRGVGFGGGGDGRCSGSE